MSLTPLIDEPPTLKNGSSIESRIDPWLARLLYPLGSYLVIPNYFDRITVTGRENIPLNGPVIVAPTHRSRWDALILPFSIGRLISGRDLRFMVSANEMKGLQGWFIRRLGGFPVNTERPGIGSVLHSVELLSEGEMVTIFPEGAIFRDNEIHRLKPGVARIALEVEEAKPRSAIKILPVSIRYSQPYPRWKSDVTVNIGESIEVADYHQGSIKRATVRLTEEISARLQALHGT